MERSKKSLQQVHISDMEINIWMRPKRDRTHVIIAIKYCMYEKKSDFMKKITMRLG